MKMTDDIVTRLRSYVYDTVYNPWIYGEAADEIERLRAALDEACDECERMRAALFRIVENGDQYSMVWAAETAHAALKDKK